MKFFYKASILCMLAFGTSYTMESDLGSFVNVQSLGVDLARIGLGKQKILLKNSWSRHCRVDESETSA